jgi:hypothetical protein
MLLAPAITHAQLFPNLGGQRAGISALTFLKMDVSPRAAAMGGAIAASPGDAFASRWNPAALTDFDGTVVGVSNTFWAAGINHAFVTASHPFDVFGTAAFTATALSSGPMEKRTELQPQGTGEVFHANNVALGFTYAKQLSSMFSFGVTGKYVNETLDNYTAHTGVFDLGFAYRTDVRNLRFAVVVKNFGPNSSLRGDEKILPVNNKSTFLESYPAPTVFSVAVSIDVIDNDKHNLHSAVQLNHPNDNAENIRLGVEYAYRDFLFARAGYKVNVDDQIYPTGGVGFRTRLGKHPLHLDYAVDPMPFLGVQQRVGISILFNQDSRGDTSLDDQDTE